MKHVTTLLLAIVLIASPLSAQPTPHTISRTVESIVTVQWDGTDKDGEATGSYCTGFVVGPTWVLTAEHCLPHGDNANAEVMVDGKPSHLLKKSEFLALLSIEPMSKPILQVRKGRLKVGETVASFGYAYGGPVMVLQRHVAAYLPPGGFATHDHLIMDNPIIGGMSGGPVVDSAGEVVGVNQAGTNEISIATTDQEIRDFLK